MRRISILEENYMALESKIAEAIDLADERVLDVVSDSRQLIDSLMSKVSDKVNFHKDPEFMNFRNDPNLGVSSMGDSTQSALASSAEFIRGISSISLEDSALASKAYAAVIGLPEESHDDEVSEVVFIFGKEGSDIPDSRDNSFSVSVKDEGKQNAMRKIAELQGVLSSARQDLESALEEGGSAEKLHAAMEKISLIKLVSEALSK
jgi:hypothetical protein